MKQKKNWIKQIIDKAKKRSNEIDTKKPKRQSMTKLVKEARENPLEVYQAQDKETRETA